VVYGSDPCKVLFVLFSDDGFVFAVEHEGKLKMLRQEMISGVLVED